MQDLQKVPFVEIDLVQQQLKECGVKIAVSTINKLKEQNGNNDFYNAITILCDRNKIEKIKAPVRYLNGILENLKKKPDNSYYKQSDNSKKLRFNNFEGREYDYEDLEKKLLGWDK